MILFLCTSYCGGVNDYKNKQINGTFRLHLHGDHKEHDHFIGQTEEDKKKPVDVISFQSHCI